MSIKKTIQRGDFPELQIRADSRRIYVETPEGEEVTHLPLRAGARASLILSGDPPEGAAQVREQKAYDDGKRQGAQDVCAEIEDDDGPLQEWIEDLLEEAPLDKIDGIGEAKEKAIIETICDTVREHTGGLLSRIGGRLGGVLGGLIR